MSDSTDAALQRLLNLLGDRSDASATGSHEVDSEINELKEISKLNFEGHGDSKSTRSRNIKTYPWQKPDDGLTPLQKHRAAMARLQDSAAQEHREREARFRAASQITQNSSHEAFMTCEVSSLKTDVITSMANGEQHGVFKLSWEGGARDKNTSYDSISTLSSIPNSSVCHQHSEAQNSQPHYSRLDTLPPPILSTSDLIYSSRSTISTLPYPPARQHEQPKELRPSPVSTSVAVVRTAQPKEHLSSSSSTNDLHTQSATPTTTNSSKGHVVPQQGRYQGPSALVAAAQLPKKWSWDIDRESRNIDAGRKAIGHS